MQSADLLRPPPVSRRWLDVEEGRQPLAQSGGCLAIRPVEHPPGVLLVAAALDEPRPSERREVVGDEALGESSRVLDLADAELALGEEGEDAQPVLVAEKPEDTGPVQSPGVSL